MINMTTITNGVFELLRQNLSDYEIRRNAGDPSRSGRLSPGKATINVIRGPVIYVPRTTGSQPWLARIKVLLGVKAESMRSPEDAEEAMNAAEKAIMDVLNTATGRKLNNTVDMVVDILIEPEIYGDVEEPYLMVETITITAEVRA